MSATNQRAKRSCYLCDRYIISLLLSLLFEYLELHTNFKICFVFSSQEDERPMSPFYVRYLLNCFIFLCGIDLLSELNVRNHARNAKQIVIKLKINV